VLSPLQIRTVNDEKEILSELGVIAELAQEYAAHSMSYNTKRSYASDLRDFELWCSSKGLISMPADPCSVACYLADRVANSFTDPKGKNQAPLKASSLARRLTFISKAHQIGGFKFDRQHPSIQQTWKIKKD
jgi:site-specific recombinase XerD